MSERTDRRAELGLTQSAAATKAGVSLATWRRWEEDPELVSVRTRTACEGVLATEGPFSRALAESAAAFGVAWSDSPHLTPRQAYALSVTLDGWADLHIEEWIVRPDEPLHTVPPFDNLDLRVMMHVAESRAWAEAVRQRCYAVSDEIERGILPFDRPGPLIDEVLIGAALGSARAYLEDMPELFDRIPARAAFEDDANDVYLVGDDDWDAVWDGFDERCRSDVWEVPLHRQHPLLPAILAERHPYTWCDTVEASGPGYLQGLTGLAVDV